MFFIKLLFFITIGIIIVVFATNNMDFVNVNFYPIALEVNMPVSLLILLSFISGVLFSLVLFIPWRLKAFKEIFFQKKKISKLEKELTKQKSQDLGDLYDS